MGGFGSQDIVDFLFGADIDATHRVVHQNGAGCSGEGAGEQNLLLVAAGQRKNFVAHVGRADFDALFPLRAEFGFLAPVHHACR
ncbi:hypothetical protein D3C72_2378000 [compost metagenome]